MDNLHKGIASEVEYIIDKYYTDIDNKEDVVNTVTNRIFKNEYIWEIISDAIEEYIDDIISQKQH